MTMLLVLSLVLASMDARGVTPLIAWVVLDGGGTQYTSIYTVLFIYIYGTGVDIKSKLCFIVFSFCHCFFLLLFGGFVLFCLFSTAVAFLAVAVSVVI